MFGLQKASVLKRVSAFFLDIVLLLVVVTGAMYAISSITGFDSHYDELDAYHSEYAIKYGLDEFEIGGKKIESLYDINADNYNSLPEEAKVKYDEAYRALLSDEGVLRVYTLIMNLSLLMTSLSIFIAYAILEFAIPLILKNGQTLGKKVFELGVMRVDGVRLSTFQLFVRTILGKYTIGTMIPVMIVIMLLTGSIGFVGTLVIILLLVLQIAVMFITKTNSTIHDLLAVTVVVDLSTQMIFESEEKLIEYKKKVAAEIADKSEY